ncbi:hypothetical protein V6N13_069059 [Hibiscus sabdariffa]|uniref:Uncharacterized protein n=1 Tax=Hibiscus sabdariffa TaxID=183260 RepID=A0ABR2QPG3_9ROSI
MVDGNEEKLIWELGISSENWGKKPEKKGNNDTVLTKQEEPTYSATIEFDPTRPQPVTGPQGEKEYGVRTE